MFRYPRNRLSCECEWRDSTRTFQGNRAPERMSKARVLLAEDHEMTLEWVCIVLNSEFDIFGRVRNGRMPLRSAAP
jgi:hypothetical protein